MTWHYIRYWYDINRYRPDRGGLDTMAASDELSEVDYMLKDESQGVVVRPSTHPDHPGKLDLMYRGVVYVRFTPDQVQECIQEMQRALADLDWP